MDSSDEDIAPAVCPSGADPLRLAFLRGIFPQNVDDINWSLFQARDAVFSQLPVVAPAARGRKFKGFAFPALSHIDTSLFSARRLREITTGVCEDAALFATARLLAGAFASLPPPAVHARRRM